jgi:hypothetical protein
MKHSSSFEQNSFFYRHLSYNFTPTVSLTPVKMEQHDKPGTYRRLVEEFCMEEQNALVIAQNERCMILIFLPSICLASKAFGVFMPNISMEGMVSLISATINPPLQLTGTSR